MAKKTYSVLMPVDYDNQRYDIGAGIDLEEKHAAPLLAVQAISEPTTASAPPADTAPEDASERLAAITTAIGQLDPDNAGLWLKDGKPKSDAISAVLGWPVSAAERDAAWNLIQPAQA